jgi:hypothetical protein
MRYPFEPSDEGPTSWIAHKNKGKQCYDREQFEEALDSYTAALNPVLDAPRQERQIVLSNMVACRLKIGGPAQVTAAVENAKKCVQLNPKWAKGHVRLASAYIALGDHSNDACNELQTALRLDSGNSLARQMLMRELRRDHAAASAASNQDGVDGDDNRHSVPPQNPNYAPPGNRGDPPHTVRFEDPIDDSVSMVDRIKFSFARVASWYSNQSDDVKMLVKGSVAILLLYVAFGGRFGLENMFASNHPHRGRGNYDGGSAYDQFHRPTSTYSDQGRGHRHDTHRNTGSTGRDYGGYNNGNNYGGGHNDYSRGYGHGGHGGGHGGFSSGLSDGTLPSVLIVMGVAYMCHRNGINPMHAMLMMNVMGGGRRRGGGFRYGGGGGMMGMGGYGGGGARMRRRGRW